MVLFSCLVAPAAWAADSGRHTYLVGLKDEGTLARLSEDGTVKAVHQARAFDNVHVAAIELTDSEAQALNKDPRVRYAEPSVSRQPLTMQYVANPFPTDYVNRWLDQMSIPKLWQVGFNGQGVKIVVIDTGVLTNQIDLQRPISGQNLATHGPLTDGDAKAHGTGMVGIIAAQMNHLGVVGGAYGADIYVYGATKDNVSIDQSLVVEAIDDAIAVKKSSPGPMVVNMSFGGTGYSQAEADAVKRGQAADILFVAAAGNSGDAVCSKPVEYPAALPGVLSVSALDNNLTRSSLAQCGAMFMGFYAVTSTTKPAGGVFNDVLTDTGEEVLGTSISTYDGPNLSGVLRDVGTGQKSSDWAGCSVGCIGLIHGVSGFDDTQPSPVVDNMVSAGAAGGIYIGPSAVTTGVLWSQTNLSAFVVSYLGSEASRFNALVGKTVTLRRGWCDFGGPGGTSNASAEVAVVAALVWGTAPTATSATIVNALLFGAQHLGTTPAYTRDPQYGYGKVDAMGAYYYLHPPRRRAAAH